MAILLSTSLFVLRLRALSGSELFFLSVVIAASQGLAWALILTFMSQVFPVKLLGNQMAGLTEVGSVCWYTHCPRCLLQCLLPVDVVVFCMVISLFQCYLPCCMPFQMWVPFCNSAVHWLCLEPHHPGRLPTWLSSVNPSGLWLKRYFFSKTFLDHSIWSYHITFFSLTLYTGLFYFISSLFLSYITFFHSMYLCLLYSIFNFLIHNLFY